MALSETLLSAVRERLAVEGTPLCDPASQEALDRSEELLGFRLPDDVRDFFRSVCNGGGVGFLGVVRGCTDDLGNTGVDLAMEAAKPDPNEAESESGYEPRSDVLAIYYWGCATYSWVDRTGQMVGSDGWSWIADDRTFVEWLRAWANGDLEQPMP
jgi:hypothetical protein